MKISVLIPTYNASSTIGMSLSSVFNQTIKPDEIIVLVDGGTDDTISQLAPLTGRIKVIIQENMGVANARNRLVDLANGDILAFLDADDIWHPNYLEVQYRHLQDHPDAVASFTGHITFSGGGQFDWPDKLPDGISKGTLISPLEFFRRYNKTTALFGSMSYCCVSRSVFEEIGPDPFSKELHGVEDSYLCYQLALLGSVIFIPSPLVAYRLTEGSLSVNRLRNLGRWVKAFEMLEKPYRERATPAMVRAFSAGYASKRREFAKVLLGAGKSVEARRQLLSSIFSCWQLVSLVKSSGLMILSLLPAAMQPRWPSTVRHAGAGIEVRESKDMH